MNSISLPPESDRRGILKLIVTGLSNREIGDKLFISERTVRNHVTSILSQLQLRDRTQAAVYASQFWPRNIDPVINKLARSPITGLTPNIYGGGIVT